MVHNIQTALSRGDGDVCSCVIKNHRAIPNMCAGFLALNGDISLEGAGCSISVAYIVNCKVISKHHISALAVAPDNADRKPI
eukprot:1133526-Pelagomonas_calceolata.AAC.1